jgi:hypothetical protein
MMNACSDPIGMTHLFLTDLGVIWCLSPRDRGHEAGRAADHHEAVGRGSGKVGLEHVLGDVADAPLPCDTSPRGLVHDIEDL